MSDRIQADLLREWRLAKQLELNIVAREANLSIGQIRQLEEGGDSCFYSPAIKESAARKVAQVLGGDPDQVIKIPATDLQVNAPLESPSSLVEDLIDLQKSPVKIQMKAPWRMKRMLLVTALLVMAIMALSLAAKQQAYESMFPELHKATRLFGETGHQTPSETESAALVSTNSNSSASASASADANEPTSPSAFSPATVGLSDSPATAEVKVSSALCQKSVDGPIITPKSPSKSGDMVHIVAQKSGSVCVQDGSGKTTLLSLQAQATKSVYGLAPWRLYFEHAAQVELYFQGERLRIPDVNSLTVALHEVTLSR